MLEIDIFILLPLLYTDTKGSAFCKGFFIVVGSGLNLLFFKLENILLSLNLRFIC